MCTLMSTYPCTCHLPLRLRFLASGNIKVSAAAGAVKVLAPVLRVNAHALDEHGSMEEALWPALQRRSLGAMDPQLVRSKADAQSRQHGCQIYRC